MEFKGTKGVRTVIEREEWFDVMDENGDRITSFCKDDERSKYDALIDAHAPEMLEMLSNVNDRLIRRTLPTESEVNQFAKDIQDLLTRATTI